MKDVNHQEIIQKVDQILAQPSPKTQERHTNELRGQTIKSLIGLISAVKDLDEQNQKLEERNIDLQSKMLTLTYVMGAVAIVTFITEILLPTLRFFFH